MNQPHAQRREPLGILIGTDHGLLECVPGAEPTRGIDGPRITSVDARGDVAIACAPASNDGREDGGAWLHTGARWQRVWDGDARFVCIGDPGVYLGTGDGHLLHSNDAGTTWDETPGIAHLRHDGAALPPRLHPPAVTGVAEVAGGLVVAFENGGTWYTADDGGSWFRRDEGQDAQVHRLYRHPTEDNRLYVTTDSGLYRSSDQGHVWTQSLIDLDRGWGGSLAVMPGTTDTLLLGLGRSAPGVEGALFRSTDGGRGWSRLLLDGEDEWARVPAIVRPHEWEDVAFVAAGARLFASHDRGASWMPLAEGLPPANVIAASL